MIGQGYVGKALEFRRETEVTKLCQEYERRKRSSMFLLTSLKQALEMKLIKE